MSKNPELMDGPHVMLAGVLKATREVEPNEEGAWRNPVVKSCMDRHFQDREPDPALIARILRKDVSGDEADVAMKIGKVEIATPSESYQTKEA